MKLGMCKAVTVANMYTQNEVVTFFFIKNRNYVCVYVWMYGCLSVPFGGLIRKSGES